MAPIRLTLKGTSTIELPLDWTPDQALAVFEVLGAMREHLWACYGEEIQQELRLQQSVAKPHMPTGIEDSDVPFWSPEWLPTIQQAHPGSSNSALRKPSSRGF